MERNSTLPVAALVLFGVAAALAQTEAPAPPANPPTPVAASDSAKKEGGGEAAAPDAKAKDTAKSTTEITADECKFNQRTHLGVFSKNVRVENPQFVLTCDRLTAHLRHDDSKVPGQAKPGGETPAGAKLAPLSGAVVTVDGTPATPRLVKSGAKSAKGKGPASPAPATPAPSAAPAGKAAPGAPDPKSGGLEKADAEGNVLIVQDKTEADGSITHGIAHAQRALYDGTTGDVTLLGKPDVQQGINHCIALNENTVIILNRDGNMTVHGKSKTVLVNTSTSPGSTPPAAPATPSPGN
jgi:lipopolysaccharide export system protein LptA